MRPERFRPRISVGFGGGQKFGRLGPKLSNDGVPGWTSLWYSLHETNLDEVLYLGIPGRCGLLQKGDYSSNEVTCKTRRFILKRGSG